MHRKRKWNKSIELKGEKISLSAVFFTLVKDFDSNIRQNVVKQNQNIPKQIEFCKMPQSRELESV